MAPPPVAKVASEPTDLNDDATWAAALNAAFTRLQAEVRQRAHSVLGGELARMLGASGHVAAALARSEAPPGPEARGEPGPGKPARATAAPARPSPAPSAQLTAPFLIGEPVAAPAATTRPAARSAKPEPDAPAPVAPVVRRRSAKAAPGDAAAASSVTDPLARQADPPTSTPQLTLAGLAPEPDPSELDEADAGDDTEADDLIADGGDGLAAGAASADDAQRERERRRDERREARMQRRQWRQERARQRRAEARMRQSAKFPGNGAAPGPGMWSPDAAPANAPDAAPAAAGPAARDGSGAAASERATVAQAELALAGDAAVDDAADDADAVEPAQATDGRKRIRWTRETIITELASFLVSGTVIDASFIERYGPPGLVAATRRVFGRFDAALNVAGLHVAKLYPDGPPAR